MRKCAVGLPRWASVGIALLVILGSGLAWAQERVCPDGNKAYFGVCPEPSQPQPLPQPQPAPSTPSVSTPPSAQPRRALVIGNAAYADRPLANPVNDATGLAAALRRLGFDVTLHRDADKLTMERAIEAFTQGASRGSAGLFFFAGHGVQIEGANYLIPIGAVFSAPVDVKNRAVSADWVLGRMEDSRMDVKLLILDACRTNPLGRSWNRGGSDGLVAMDATKGSFIAYSTGPGKTAADGDGTSRNSPYTAQLLRELAVPGRSIHDVFEAVRAGVLATTQGKQLPWEATALIGKFYFAR